LELSRKVFEFIRDRPDQFMRLLEAHLRLSVSALLIAVVVFIPIGVICARWLSFGSAAVGTIAALRVIPSLALVLLLYPWLGLGYTPTLVALVILAGPPLVLNTYAGLRNVDASVLEAARGIGMRPIQAFFRVQLPLALPVMIAGMRTAAVEIIASATLASFVGVTSFGQWILTGISLLDNTYLLAGAIPIMGLVLAAELLFGGLERLVTPRMA
jgi:osmoprotectant transport system permease protein